MTSAIDDALLAAYMDGELDDTHGRAVEAALAEDPALRARLEKLRSIDSAVRAAFDQIADLPAPALRAPVVSMAESRGWRNRWQLPLAAAASLLCLLATGAVSYHLGQQEQLHATRARETESVAVERTFQRVIETELSGTTVEWRNPQGDSRAEFTPVRTWRTEAGRYCREFTERRFRAGVEREEGGIACRNEDGTWRVRVRYFPG